MRDAFANIRGAREKSCKPFQGLVAMNKLQKFLIKEVKSVKLLLEKQKSVNKIYNYIRDLYTYTLIIYHNYIHILYSADRR